MRWGVATTSCFSVLSRKIEAASGDGNLLPGLRGSRNLRGSEVEEKVGGVAVAAVS